MIRKHNVQLFGGYLSWKKTFGESLFALDTSLLTWLSQSAPSQCSSMGKTAHAHTIFKASSTNEDICTPASVDDSTSQNLSFGVAAWEGTLSDKFVILLANRMKDHCNDLILQMTSAIHLYAQCLSHRHIPVHSHIRDTHVYSASNHREILVHSLKPGVHTCAQPPETDRCL